MTKPEITIRLSPSLLAELNHYVQHTDTSKTDVVMNEIAQYFGCAENIPLTERMAEFERRLAALEAENRGN